MKTTHKPIIHNRSTAQITPEIEITYNGQQPNNGNFDTAFVANKP